MHPNHDREGGLKRLTYSDVSVSNQHYIVTSFIVNDIINAVDTFAKGDVLDIGCGNKPYQRLFKNISTYTGCDIIQSSENIVDFLCPANELCFNAQQFNTVFCTQVLEHVADFEGVIKESYRVLQHNGIAIFTVPFAWELHEEPYDFFRYSKHGLKAVFERHGFEIVYIKSNGGKWAAILQLLLNNLMSVRKYRTLRAKIVKLLFSTFKLMIPYNRFAVWLDKKYYDDSFTLNYIIVAKK